MQTMKLNIPVAVHGLFSLLIAASASFGNASPSDANNGQNRIESLRSDDAYVQKQIEWLKSKEGGFFSPKIVYGKLNDEDGDTSFSGMYAVAPIAKGEEMIHLPVEHFITSGRVGGKSMCDTAWNLAGEYHKGKDSDWEPYVKYNFESFPHEHLPPNWSDEAKELVQYIVGEDLEPQNLGTAGSYAIECGYDEDDEFDEILEAAYRIVVARGWNDILLPVVDMINHRNGRWYNADQAGSAHTGEDISLVALRDIAKGEQIYLSYNECRDVDCEGVAHIFTMPQILEWFGFVEQYPRRFNIGAEYEAPVFELDLEEGGKVEIKWLEEEPDEEDLEWFRGQLSRLEDLEEDIMEGLEELESHEKYTINNYYQAMLEGLELASSWGKETNDNELEMRLAEKEETEVILKAELEDKTRTIEELQRNYAEQEEILAKLRADLEAVTMNEDYGEDGEGNSVDEDDENSEDSEDSEDDEDDSDDENHDIDEDNDIDMEDSEDDDETVSSEQYEYDVLQDHRDILNYEAEALCDVKYVVPGKLVSHEEVTSFYQHMEFKIYSDAQGNKLNTCLYMDDWVHSCTSLRPHYHEWFVHYPAQYLKQMKRVLFLGGGDAMILHEVLKYPELELVIGMELDPSVLRGSFKHFRTEPHYDDDRVHWWFGDAAKSLSMLPDEYLGTFDLVLIDLITYVVDSLMVTDELSILDYSMLLLNEGGVLFMNEDWIVPTKANHAQYTVDLEMMEMPIWCHQSMNMLSNAVDFMTAEPIDHGVETMVVKPGAAKGDPQKFDSWWNYHRNTQHKMKERKAATIDASDNSRGVMIVLEAEDVTQSMTSLADVNATIAKSLQKSGLTVLSTSSFETKALFLALQEGYVMLRSWPEHKYYAVDLMLWSKLDKLDEAKAGLITAVGAGSTSSYRFISGGMRGVEAVEVSEFPVETKSDSSTCAEPDAPVTTAFEPGDLDLIVEEMSALVQSNEPVVTFVLCADKGNSCQGLEIINKGKTIKSGTVFSVSACASGESMKRDTDCEDAVLDSMKSAQCKIDLIVIDSEVPRKMGHVLKEILKNSFNRIELLAEQFVVLAPTVDSSDSWRNALLEWFRTDVGTHTPDHHAEIFFGSASRSGTLKIGVFSSGDKDFYPHLLKVIEKCESKKGLVAEVRSVRDGLHSFMPDFEPSIVANESSYDKSSANNQWTSQNPLGMQAILQFQSKIPQAPLTVGEKVLGNYHTHPLTGKWFPATVESKNEDGTYDLKYYDKERAAGVERRLIRKWEHAVHVSISETVLAMAGDDGDYFAGKVLEKMPRNEYTVNIYDGSGTIEIVNGRNIMKRFETSDQSPAPAEVSCTMLKKILQKGVSAYDQTRQEIVQIHNGTGDGCVATALWSQGSAIATWDGGHHMDLNLFTFEEDKHMHQAFSEVLLETIPSFELVSYDEYPRGSGRVVNFKHEMTFSS